MNYLQDFPIKEFQEKLLYWFERNMRDLPWRQDKDPYKIWVSEIMLQQTRVDTVIPYFHRFIEKFPSLEALALAKEDEVLKQWEGLGYYSRARNLHSAVQEVMESYEGVVPNSLKEISSLKGVGSYTAGAILSIAYGQKEPAVDGNVMRVFSRILAIEEDIQKPKTKKLFEEIVKQLIPDNASYFNQGIMELGALICTPQSPKCLTCPVSEHCRGKEKGIQASLPVKTKKKKPRYLQMVAGVIQQDGKVLIRQREEEGLLARLYEFPNVEWTSVSPEETISKHLFEQYQIESVIIDRLESVQHTFSHLVWDITVFQLKELKKVSQHDLGILKTNAKWVELEELDRYTFPVSHQKIKNQLLPNS